ncbi:hypothetical protein [Streptomyces sp. SS8]
MAVLAVVTAVIAYSMRDDEYLRANRAQVRKACAGLLPAAHLDPFLPRDSAVTHGQYGTLLDPGHESRAFIDCRLDWTGDGGNGDRSVHMRAEPWGPDDVVPSTCTTGKLNGWEVARGLSHRLNKWERNSKRLQGRLDAELTGLEQTNTLFGNNETDTKASFNGISPPYRSALSDYAPGAGSSPSPNLDRPAAKSPIAGF